MKSMNAINQIENIRVRQSLRKTAWKYRKCIFFNLDGEPVVVNTIDGGPGSGYEDHPGRPGKVGGSLKSADTANSEIADAYSKGDTTSLKSAVRSALAGAALGTTVKMTFGGESLTLKKTDDNRYEYEKNGRKYTVNATYILQNMSTGSLTDLPTLADPEVEERKELVKTSQASKKAAKKSGASAGSTSLAETLNKQITDAYKTGDYTDVNKAVRAALKEIPVGATFTSKGTTWTKTGDNEYTNYSSSYSNGAHATGNDNIIVNGSDPFNVENAVRFNEIGTVGAAEETTGKDQPDTNKTSTEANGFVSESESVGKVTNPETGETLFVPAYNGKTEFEYNFINQESMNNKKVEFTQYNLNHGIEEVCSDEDVERMVKSAEAYFGYKCQEILSTQSPGLYPLVESSMSEEDKQWAKIQADNLEELIEKSDKVDKSVYRGIGLNNFYQDGVDEFIDTLKTGAIIDMGHIASWSTDKKTAKSYSERIIDYEFDKGTEYSVMFTLKNPKSVADMICILPYGECLSPSKAKFKISGVSRTYDEELYLYKYDVELEEV